MRRFEYTEGTSSKFWSIEREGSSFTVSWGKIGTAGQTQTKSFPSDDKATTEHDKLVKEKVGKGYVEVGASSAAPAASAKAAPAASAKPAPAASAKPAPAASTKAAPAASAKPAPTAAPKPPAKTVAATPVAAEALVVQTPRAQPQSASADGDEHDAPDGTIVWTPTIADRVVPRRGGHVTPKAPSADPKKAWAAMQTAIEKIRPQLRSGKRSKSCEREVMDAIDERFDPSVKAPPDPMGADLEAAIHALLNETAGWKGSSAAEHHVGYLVAAGGHALTTESVLRSFGWVLDSNAQKSFPLVRGPKQHWQSIAGGRAGTLEPLRAHLAAANDDAYAEALAVATKLRGASKSLHAEEEHLLVATAYLFPTEKGWVEDAVRALGGGKKGRRDASLLLLFSITDAAQLETIAGGRRPYELVGGDSDPAPTLLDGLGTEVVPFIAKVLGDSEIAEWKRSLAECLSVVCSDAALTPLFANLDDKQIGPFALAAAQRWPRRAVRLLAPMSGTRGKAGDPARALLEQIVRTHGASVDAWLANVDDGARKLVAAMRAETAVTVRDARADEIPETLASPPWRRAKKRAAARVVTGLPVLPTPDRMAWTDGEKATWEKTRGSAWYQWQHKGLTGRSLWEAELTRITTPDKHGRDRLDPAWLVDAPVEMARPYLPRWKSSAWHAAPWIPALVARYELELLPTLVELAAEKPADVFEGLLPYASTGLAPRVADALFRLKSIRPIARRWLLRHPETAAIGLLPLALGPGGKARDSAEHAIRFLAERGHESVVRDVAARYGKPAQDALEDVLSYDPLELFPDKLPKMPGFWVPASLPTPLLRSKEAALPDSAVEALGEMLAFSTLDAPYAGLDSVRESCDPASLARFSWALFQAWLQAGAASKEQWGLLSLAWLGDDECARKLALLVREWPGEAAHARAVIGLDVLAAIGSDVALMHLNRMAEKLKFKGLQDKAREKIADIAESRGMSQDELADRLAPDLGLDPDGSVTLDFGPRAFRVGFDEHLSPYVLGPDGARIGDLPKPGKADDAEKAKEAKERWQALKKDAKTASGTQVIRLEQAMCKQRRFATDAFRALFVEHPLLVHVVRRLVWATFDADGKLRDTFRVAEDRSYADAADDAFELPAGVLVGIPHRMELPDDVAARWGQVLGDYEILQPFPQLGREVFTRTPAESKAKHVERVVGRKVATGTVLGLEQHGWRRGPALDGGVVCWMIKPLTKDQEARLDLDPGLFTGMLSEAPEQTLGKVCVSKAGGWGWSAEETVALSTLAPLVFSEIVRDVTSLEH